MALLAGNSRFNTLSVLDLYSVGAAPEGEGFIFSLIVDSSFIDNNYGVYQEILTRVCQTTKLDYDIDVSFGCLVHTQDRLGESRPCAISETFPRTLLPLSPFTLYARDGGKYILSLVLIEWLVWILSSTVSVHGLGGTPYRPNSPQSQLIWPGILPLTSRQVGGVCLVPVRRFSLLCTKGIDFCVVVL